MEAIWSPAGLCPFALHRGETNAFPEVGRYGHHDNALPRYGRCHHEPRRSIGHVGADRLDEHSRAGSTPQRCCQMAECWSLGVIAGVFVGSAELYDPRLGTWAPTGSMSTARAGSTPQRYCQMAECWSRGVIDSYLGYLGSAELYDPRLGTWSPTAAMSTARSNHTATLLTRWSGACQRRFPHFTLGKRGNLRSGAGHLVVDAFDEHGAGRPHGHAAARRPGARQRGAIRRSTTPPTPRPAPRSTIRRSAPGHRRAR